MKEAYWESHYECSLCGEHSTYKSTECPFCHSHMRNHERIMASDERDTEKIEGIINAPSPKLTKEEAAQALRKYGILTETNEIAEEFKDIIVKES